MGTNAREVGDYSLAVSAELRAAIAHKGYSVRAFASAFNIPMTTLHRTLRGERVVDVEDLAQICGALNLDPSAVLERAEAELARTLDGALPVIADSRYANRGTQESGLRVVPRPDNEPHDQPETLRYAAHRDNLGETPTDDGA